MMNRNSHLEGDFADYSAGADLVDAGRSSS